MKKQASSDCGNWTGRRVSVVSRGGHALVHRFLSLGGLQETMRPAVFPHRRKVLASLCCGLAVFAHRTAAAQAMPARLRLIDGGIEPGGMWRGGVELVLHPGWKTYWRSPGGSGIPPVFDWAGSLNLDNIELAYPAPSLLGEGSGAFLGYTGQVVFPVSARIIAPGETAELVLNFAYGLCERICIPAEGQARLHLGAPAASQSDRSMLERALARLPRRQAAGAMVRDWHFDRGNRRIEFSVDMPGGIACAAVEGPTDWGVGMATALDRDGDLQRFAVEIASPPAASDAGSLLVTLVGRRTAVEEVHTLDG